ncbi:C-factor [Phytophthora nicotianae]|nr:C-factor [Phytophthora nicotianae]
MRDNALVNVLLLQGPCSFVRGVWTGGDIKRKELQHQIQALADDQKIVVKHREYDSEKIILHMLLEAREDQVVVLCWNISLAKSPFVVHALGLIQSRVIIVSPNNVDHGPLPASVVGVLSGFWNQSISLALSAATNLLAKQTDFSSAKNSQNSAGIASSKKGVLSAKTKKKALTCYLCGKEGHIRSKCPELPRNKV